MLINMTGYNEAIRNGFETAYIDGAVVSNTAYQPQFVSNNHKEGKKVLSSIEDELFILISVNRDTRRV